MPRQTTTTFEEKRLGPIEADEILVRAMKQKRGELTRADAIAASGLPAHIVDDSLERLIKHYKSHLDVTEEGELLYSFDPSFRRRDVPTLRERLRAVGRRAARAGIWIFKGWIAVTLVAYVVAFVVLLIGLMVSSNGNDRDRRSSRGGDGLGWLWLWMMPDWGYGYGATRRYDAWGRPLRVEPPRARRKGPKKAFFATIFDFVFGPPEAHDALADEREFVAYLRANKARVTATDLVALHGWSYRRAEEEVARLMVDYEGEPEITADGVIVYAFPKVLKSTGPDSSAAYAALGDGRAPAIRYAWDRLEPRPVLTGNSTTADWAIGGFAVFNVIMSTVAADAAARTYGLVGAGWSFALHGFPLAFFALFLAIPGARALARRVGDGRREARNAKRKLLEKIVDTKGGPLPEAPGMKELALELEGEVDADVEAGDAAQALYTFPRVGEELVALAAHVATVDVAAERRVGAKIFGAGDEEVDALEKANDEAGTDTAQVPRSRPKRLLQ